MILFKLVIIIFIATTAMLLSNSFISVFFRKQYNEPMFLELLVDRFGTKFSMTITNFLNWFLNYFIGCLFILTLFIPVWCDFGWYTIDLRTSIAFGIGCSIVGCVGWHILFKKLPEKVPSKLSGYYFQLIFSHLTFGLSTYLINDYMLIL